MLSALFITVSLAAVPLSVTPSSKGSSLTVAVRAEQVPDTFELSVFFPDSGVTSRGFIYRFTGKGKLVPSGESGPPAFATKLVKASATTDPITKAWALDIEVPARALPRFAAASRPLRVSVCGEASRVGVESKPNSCPTGDMQFGLFALSEDFVASLKLVAVPPLVEGIEPRENGFVGFSKRHAAVWAQAGSSAQLTWQSLNALVTAKAPIEAASVQLTVGHALTLKAVTPVRDLLTVIEGENPFSRETCDPRKALTLTMFMVEKNLARSVLTLPASTCLLGRALNIALDDEGMLEIGYTFGTIAHYVWSDDHFERSELGSLTRNRRKTLQ